MRPPAVGRSSFHQQAAQIMAAQVLATLPGKAVSLHAVHMQGSHWQPRLRPALSFKPLSECHPPCMQGGHQQPPPPSSAAPVHRQAISLPPASPQAQLPEQLQLQLLPSADERHTLAMPFGGHGRPTTPELTAAMGQLSSLVTWDQIMAFSGNPLEGLVQMVSNFAQVRGAMLCCQVLQAVGQHVAR